MKRTLFVNIYGAPGSGKSTLAAELFTLFKKEGKYKTELVTEYAKDVTYGENKAALADQFYLTAKQEHRMNRLDGKVDLVISDSGLLNACIYKIFYDGVECDRAFIASDSAKQMDKTFSNLNFLLKRTKEYKGYGRVQDEQESDHIHDLFVSFFQNNNFGVTHIGHVDIVKLKDIIDYELGKNTNV